MFQTFMRDVILEATTPSLMVEAQAAECHINSIIKNHNQEQTFRTYVIDVVAFGSFCNYRHIHYIVYGVPNRIYRFPHHYNRSLKSPY